MVPSISRLDYTNTKPISFVLAVLYNLVKLFIYKGKKISEKLIIFKF